MPTYTSSVNNRYNLRLVLSQGEQDIPNNKTPLHYYLYLDNGAASFKLYTITGSYLNINGSRVWTAGTGNISIDGWHRETLLASGVIDIPHNSDGTKTVSAYAHFKVNGSASYLPYGAITLSANMALTAIPRATEIVSVGNISTASSSITVNLNKKHSSYTHYIALYIGDTWVAEWTGSAANFDKEKSLTLASGHIKNILVAMPNTSSTTGQLRVRTLSGTNIIGQANRNLTITVDSGRKPTITSLSVTTRTKLRDSTITELYKYFGELEISFDLTVPIGATIKEKKVTFAGAGGTYGTGTETTNFKIKPLVAGSQTLAIKITDSRGRTATWSKSYHVFDYKPVTIRNLYVGRSRDTNTLKEYLEFEVQTTTSEIKPSGTELNKTTIKVEYSEKGKNSWETLPLYTDIPTGTHNYGSTPSTIFHLTKIYDIRITATDELTSAAILVVMSTADYTLSLGKNVVGVNMIPTIQKGLEVNGPIYSLSKKVLTDDNMSFSYRGSLENANNALQAGSYSVSSSSINVPNQFGVLLVYRRDGSNSSYIFQEMRNYQNLIWVRTRYQDNWTEWRSI